MPRTISICDADIDALVAIRPVVADANQHPGRAAAIAAIDRLSEQLGHERALAADEAATQRQRAAEPASEMRAVPSAQVRAQICALFGFERVEVLREELEERYRVSALRGGHFASEHVTDGDLDVAGAGTSWTAWFDAFHALAGALEVPGAGARLEELAKVLRGP